MLLAGEPASPAGLFVPFLKERNRKNVPFWILSGELSRKAQPFSPAGGTGERFVSQAKVRVKVNWVTPSSLVTEMSSRRPPRIVLTIYRPRPTPSRSILRE